MQGAPTPDAGVRLDWISLAQYRSYEEVMWSPTPTVNVLVGRNGAGKSNLMEAIGYLASLKSFRGAPDDALVAHDADSAVIRGEVFAEQVSTLLEIEIKRRGGRRTMMNKQKLARTADLIEHIRIVTFLPEDLDIVKRGPDRRRGFLDEVAVQLAPASHLDQAEFDRALRQRNAFLRQRYDDEATLSVWDERLAQAGGKVMARRARAAAELAPALTTSYGEIAEESASIGFRYSSGWGGTLDPTVPAGEFTDRLGEALAASHRLDRDRGVTTMGPHRDEPVLELDGHDLRHHGSQGEQRTAALSLRLATHRAVSERVGMLPLLLLDDVFSELDPGRAAALARALPGSQALITTADRTDVPIDGRIWTVAEGGIR